MYTKLTIGIITVAAIMMALGPVLVGVHQASAKHAQTQTCTSSNGANSGTSGGSCQGNSESSPVFQQCTTTHQGNSVNSPVTGQSCT
jgi:hypothetical protein